MREIKYRALDAATKKWVYGYYVVLDSGYELVECIWELGAERATPIDPSTLGQYTGLFDKDGREIYEGDILRLLNSEVLCEVIYEAPSFCRRWISPKVSSLRGVEMESMAHNTHIAYEVIGNIYQHKNLLKENEKC